jgi:SAM-dependent methyltransferase
MSDSRPHGLRHVERHCDVLVVGATSAGLDAALDLARLGLGALVLDVDPASAVSAGTGPGEASAGAGPTLAERREEVRSHGVEVLVGRVIKVTRLDGGSLRVELASGHSVVARRLLDATVVEGGRPGAPELAPFAVGGSGETVATADSIVREDGLGPARPSANEADWEHRYGDEQMWSGNPNGSLVAEVGGMAPGRALDVGAGEGADALWLAEQGWRVTAADISARALARGRTEAERRGLLVEWRQADANAPGAFERQAFDLVCAQYASLPRTPDGRGVANILGAVAPGGTLLIVSHDIEPMRAAVDDPELGRPFDPDAYVRVEDFVAAVRGVEGWEVELHERRARPPGAATAAHHVDDVVLRARLAGKPSPPPRPPGYPSGQPSLRDEHRPGPT